MKTKNTFDKTYLLGIISFFLLLFPFGILLFQSPEQITYFTKEDGLIENLSAFSYFAGSCLLFLIFYKSKHANKEYVFKSKRNYFFLLLGLFLFFCFGEEISWGQRIFGFASSNEMNSINLQGETNIHNLILFHSDDIHEIKKTGIKAWFTAARLFSLLWFFYCLAIPIVNSISSKSNKLFLKFHLPIVPIWVGIFFLLNHLIVKGFETFTLLENSVIEIKELNYALLFLLVGITFYNKYLIDNRLTNIHQPLHRKQ